MVTTNAGRSHLFGAEVEAAAALPWRLEAFSSLGLLRTRFDAFENQGEDYAGNQFPFAPRWSGTLGLSLKRWSRYSGQIAVTHQARVFSDPGNDPSTRVPARTLLNVRLGAQLGHGLSALLYGRNLLDDDNLQGRFEVRGRGAQRYGEARTIGAGLEWQL